MTDSKTFSPRK